MTTRASRWCANSNIRPFGIVLITGEKNMTKRSLLLLGVLALSILPMASAKSYAVAFRSPIMAGSVQLPAGDYTLKVDGSNAVFTNVETNKSVTAPVKIENAGKKYDTTAIESRQEGDAQHIKDIELGGSNTKLDFD